MRKRPRVLIVGGYGVFGRRAAERLAREADLDIVIAGRSHQRAEEMATRLRPSAKAALAATALDARQPDCAVLRHLAPAVVVNASGPFQTQDFTLARAAIAAGAHYVDLADSSRFVLGFSQDAELDRLAKTAGVLAVAGASSVPAISGAVVDALAARLRRITAVRIGISPGNSFDPGPATAASIIGTVGRPLRALHGGVWRTVHGWQGLTRHHFPNCGKRWLGYCDVPDLTLFPARHPGLATVDFRAGVEVPLFHLGLWLLSWPARAGVLRSPARLAAPLLALKRRLGVLGSDAGGMFVEVDGIDDASVERTLTWHLEAFAGHGPYIPATPTVILARRLARGEQPASGAIACLGLVTLAEIERELADLHIRMTIQ